MCCWIVSINRIISCIYFKRNVAENHFMRHFRFTWQWRLFQAHVDELKYGYNAVVFGVGCYCNHQCIFRLVWCARSIQNLLFVQLVARCCASVFHICIDIEHCSAYTSLSLTLCIFICIYIYIVNVRSCWWAYSFVVRAVFSLRYSPSVRFPLFHHHQISWVSERMWACLARLLCARDSVPCPCLWASIVWYIYIYMYFFLLLLLRLLMLKMYFTSFKRFFLFYYTVQCFQFK